MTAKRRGAIRQETVSRLLAGLETFEHGSDEALELARQSLVLFKGRFDDPRYQRLGVRVGEIVEAWATWLVAVVLRGSNMRDLDDVKGEARLWLFKQLNEFQPKDDGGSVAVFVRTRSTWFRSTVRRGASDGLQPHGGFMVVGAAAKARETLFDRLQREPSLDEIRTLAESSLREQARVKVLEKSIVDQVPLSAEELERMVDAKLSKDGVNAALARFGELWHEAVGPMYFDVQDELHSEDSGGDGRAVAWRVPLPTVEFAGGADVDPEVSYERSLRVALGDQLWARGALARFAGDQACGVEGDVEGSTWKVFAEQGGVSVGEVKRLVADARVRMLAPHAQWAYLASTLELACD